MFAFVNFYLHSRLLNWNDNNEINLLFPREICARRISIKIEHNNGYNKINIEIQMPRLHAIEFSVPAKQLAFV